MTDPIIEAIQSGVRYTFNRPWAPADPFAKAEVDCGACHACCHQLVFLTENDNYHEYETEVVLSPRGPVYYLKRRANGDCIYLKHSGGCGIYGRQPQVCRHFHCGGWFRSMTREQRQDLKRRGNSHDRKMINEGRKRALDQQ